MTELAYDAAGAGDPALLFLHGWCCDRSYFAPQFEHFSTSHRVVTVDLPAHGASAPPEVYSIEDFATAVAAFGRELELGPSVVFGHSSGAMVALELSKIAPELVGGVVMVDPPALSKEVWTSFAAQLVPSFQGPDGIAQRRTFIDQMFAPGDNPARKAQILDGMCNVPNNIAIPALAAIATYDSMTVLRSCGAPVLTISSAVPANDAAFLLEANPTMTFGQTVGSGHFLQLEVPEQVNPMIERFLAMIVQPAHA